MREEMARERELSARAAGVEQSRHDLVLRELGVLRSEVAVERELRELHAEIAAAQAAIPRVAELEARVETQLAQQAVILQRQEAELTKTRNRLGKLKVDHALTESRLAAYLEEAAKAEPRTDLEMFSSFTRFTVRDLSLSNANTLAEFATQTVDRSGTPDLRAATGGDGVVLDRTRYKPEPPRKPRKASPGYETSSVKWETLTETETLFVCRFIDALKDIGKEIAAMRLDFQRQHIDLVMQEFEETVLIMHETHDALAAEAERLDDRMRDIISKRWPEQP